VSASETGAPESIHATALVVRESGILIRGPSGAGKSGLALCLLELARQRRWFAALVGDDRVIVRSQSGRLIGQGARNIEGLIERRGQGIVKVDMTIDAVIHFAVDLASFGEEMQRIACAEAAVADIAGVSVPRLAFSAETASLERAFAVIQEIDKRSVTRK
jgi:HPr kinase/phosphorylase